MIDSGSWNVKEMIYNIRIVKIKDLQVAVRISRIFKNFDLEPKKIFDIFALSRDHKCLPKLNQLST